MIGKLPDEKIKENGPRLHEYLQEMNANTFGRRDAMTVGECWGATPEIARLYTAPERKELSMIFQFEQIQLDKKKGGQRWDLKELDLRDLKAVFSKWQYELEECGWNSLFGAITIYRALFHDGAMTGNTGNFQQKCWQLFFME